MLGYIRTPFSRKLEIRKSGYPYNVRNDGLVMFFYFLNLTYTHSFMSTEDIRWKQRFQNFKKAYVLLEEAVELSNRKGLSDLEVQGLIQRFEFTHELAWNVLKDYFEYQGNTGITGSRDATREAFNKGLVDDGEGWMQMIKSRNQSSHTYNEEVAEKLKQKIVNTYCNLFRIFSEKFTHLETR